MSNLNSMNDVLDIILKNGINRALNNVMDRSYCKILDKDINNIKQELEIKINENNEIKKLFTDYLFKVNELDKYKIETIYIQGILDTLELISMFNRYK